ncbi:MAG: TadE/TadG family type IV pilus assembly protein [Candidatus Nanopelagicales bacterium]
MNFHPYRRHLKVNRFPQDPVSTRFQAGASAVEFAIILPLLLLVVFAIIDFGRYFFGQLVLESASAEAAKIVAVKPINSFPNIENEINLFLEERINTVEALVSLNSASAQITQTHCQTGSSQITHAIVEICLPFRPLLPFNIAPTTDCPDSQSVHVIGAMVCQ